MIVLEILGWIGIVLAWTAIAVGIGAGLAWEVILRLYKRRQRLGHPDEEAAVARAMRSLHGR